MDKNKAHCALRLQKSCKIHQTLKKKCAAQPSAESRPLCSTTYCQKRSRLCSPALARHTSGSLSLSLSLSLSRSLSLAPLPLTLFLSLSLPRDCLTLACRSSKRLDAEPKLDKRDQTRRRSKRVRARPTQTKQDQKRSAQRNRAEGIDDLVSESGSVSGSLAA